jgi:hypothetical protein
VPDPILVFVMLLDATAAYVGFIRHMWNREISPTARAAAKKLAESQEWLAIKALPGIARQ